jgi:hypothetical protein
LSELRLHTLCVLWFAGSSTKKGLKPIVGCHQALSRREAAAAAPSLDQSALRDLGAIGAARSFTISTTQSASSEPSPIILLGETERRTSERAGAICFRSERASEKAKTLLGR